MILRTSHQQIHQFHHLLGDEPEVNCHRRIDHGGLPDGLCVQPVEAGRLDEVPDGAPVLVTRLQRLPQLGLFSSMCARRSRTMIVQPVNNKMKNKRAYDGIYSHQKPPDDGVKTLEVVASSCRRRSEAWASAAARAASFSAAADATAAFADSFRSKSISRSASFLTASSAFQRKRRRTSKGNNFPKKG